MHTNHDGMHIYIISIGNIASDSAWTVHFSSWWGGVERRWGEQRWLFRCSTTHLQSKGHHSALPSLHSVFGPGHDPGNFAMWHPMQRLSSEERKQQEEAAKVAGTEEILQKGSLKDEIQQGSWLKFCSWLKIVTKNCDFQGNSGWLICWKNGRIFLWIFPLVRRRCSGIDWWIHRGSYWGCLDMFSHTLIPSGHVKQIQVAAKDQAV